MLIEDKQKEQSGGYDANYKPWEPLERLQGQMNHPVMLQTSADNTIIGSGVTDSYMRAKRNEAINYLRHAFEAAGIDDQDSILEKFKELSKGLWSREYAIEIYRAFGDYETFNASNSWQAIEVGMPVEIVLENEDFYHSMLSSHQKQYDSARTLRDETYGEENIGASTFIPYDKFYEAMSKKQDGVKKFKRDFIESGVYQVDLCRAAKWIMSSSQDLLSKPDIDALMFLRELGVGKDVMAFLDGFSGHIFGGEKKTIQESNIVQALTRFIKMDANSWKDASDDDLLVKEAFVDNKTKNIALSHIRAMYENYLFGEKAQPASLPLEVIADYVSAQGGAGSLTQIGALLGFIKSLLGTSGHIRKLTAAVEQKLRDWHWGNQEKTNFYTISSEIIQASPEIYQVFAELFKNISSKDDFKAFITEVYPLYHAKLELLRDYDDHSDGLGEGYTTISYKSVDMDAMKNQLHNTLLPFNLQELSLDQRQEGIVRVKSVLLSEISELFQAKFGILPNAIPAKPDEDDTRAIEDMVLYLSNLALPNARKKDIIGFYLALRLDKNKPWNKMRIGEALPSRYLEGPSARNVLQAIRESAYNNPVNSQNLRIEDPDTLREFKLALQDDTVSIWLTDAQATDLKLQNLIGGITELTTPDLYPKGIDRQRVELLKNCPVSVKEYGKIVSDLYQKLEGRDIYFNEKAQELVDKIELILKNNGLELTPDNIKTYFQVGIRGLQVPFNILAEIHKNGLMDAIAELQSMLIPSDRLIGILNKLGEKVEPSLDGAASRIDSDFLEELVMNKGGTLSFEEIQNVNVYLDSVRKKKAEIEVVYDKVIQNYLRMKKNIHPAAREKILEIDRILSDGRPKITITTTCTNDILIISENVGACLNCKTKGVNNDTILTFGEGYKFYVYSSDKANRSGSIADEIVFFLPVGDGERRRMSFILDKVYGTKNSDIMLSHVNTILKKAHELKEKFPETPISVILSKPFMASCASEIKAAELSRQLELKDKAWDISNETVIVPKSGFGDHYVEFVDNNARTRISGRQSVSGIEIVV